MPAGAPWRRAADEVVLSISQGNQPDRDVPGN